MAAGVRAVRPALRMAAAMSARHPKESLRILVASHEYPPIGGGAGAVCKALAERYVEQGHEVVVVTMALGKAVGSERDNGVAVHRVACGRRRKEMASPWEGLRWAARSGALVRQLHRQCPFDVVHAHFIMPGGIVAQRLWRSDRVPWIVTAHGSDVPGYNRERLRLAHRVARPWWRRICREAATIVSPSTSLLGLIEEQRTLFRGVVIPNGFATTRLQAGAKQKRILLCSRLVRRKGFHHFLAAIEALDLPGWHVDIVGDGPAYDELSRLARGCRTPVTLHGWIDNHDPRLAALYQAAALFVFPSEWENCSIALLEAMSAGCAVITTDSSGNPEVVGDCATLVPVRDVPALRGAIVALTASPRQRRRLGEAAARRVTTEFDWDVIGRRYLMLLESLATRTGSSSCVSALSATRSQPGVRSAVSERTRVA
jgi:glycosyltransferase involved in cell wall biosynthesis